MYGNDYPNCYAYLSFGIYAIRRYLHGDADGYLSDGIYVGWFYLYGNGYADRYAVLSERLYFIGRYLHGDGYANCYLLKRHNPF